MEVKNGRELDYTVYHRPKNLILNQWNKDCQNACHYDQRINGDTSEKSGRNKILWNNKCFAEQSNIAVAESDEILDQNEPLNMCGTSSQNNFFPDYILPDLATLSWNHALHPVCDDEDILSPSESPVLCDAGLSSINSGITTTSSTAYISPKTLADVLTNDILGDQDQFCQSIENGHSVSGDISYLSSNFQNISSLPVSNIFPSNYSSGLCSDTQLPNSPYNVVSLPQSLSTPHIVDVNSSVIRNNATPFDNEAVPESVVLTSSEDVDQSPYILVVGLPEQQAVRESSSSIGKTSLSLEDCPPQKLQSSKIKPKKTTRSRPPIRKVEDIDKKAVYVCGVCKESFFQHTDLGIHVKEHFSKKPSKKMKKCDMPQKKRSPKETCNEFLREELTLSLPIQHCTNEQIISNCNLNMAASGQYLPSHDSGNNALIHPPNSQEVYFPKANSPFALNQSSANYRMVSSSSLMQNRMHFSLPTPELVESTSQSDHTASLCHHFSSPYSQYCSSSGSPLPSPALNSPDSPPGIYATDFYHAPSPSCSDTAVQNTRNSISSDLPFDIPIISSQQMLGTEQSHPCDSTFFSPINEDLNSVDLTNDQLDITQPDHVLSIGENSSVVDSDETKLTSGEITKHHCCDCLLTFCSSEELMEHEKEKHSLPDSSVDLLSNLATDSEKDSFKGRTKTCKFCRQKFKNTHSLQLHLESHKSLFSYKCKECGELFPYSFNLEAHMKDHLGEKPFKCPICDMCFRLYSTLKSHKRIHTGEKPYKCDECEKCFSQNQALKRHKRKHQNERPWLCSLCNSSFKHKQVLTRHIQTQHLEKSLICNICSLGFKNVKKLKRHILCHNKGNRPYKCDMCPSAFSVDKYLKQHVCRIHKKRSAVKCEHCRLTFKRRDSLRAHMKQHTDGDLHSCEVCGVNFSKLKTLKKHLRTHGIIDDDIDENSSSKDEMENEIKEKYVCEDCDQVFFRRRQLAAHQKYCLCRSSVNEIENIKSFKKTDDNFIQEGLSNDVQNKTYDFSFKNESADAVSLFTAVIAEKEFSSEELELPLLTLSSQGYSSSF